MPRYFFHTHVGGDVLPDPTGAELPDADAAWEAARATIRAALAGSPDPGLMAASLVVTDAAGEIVLEFPFGEAVTVPGDRTAH